MAESVSPKRKQIRLRNYDYSKNGCYFVTVCVAGKKHLLAHYKSKEDIVGAGLRARSQDALSLTAVGTDVEKAIRYIARNYENVQIENAVVMPNHIHLLVMLDDSEGRHTGEHGNPPLHSVIGQLKSYTTKWYREITGQKSEKLWQRGFYDRVIRNEAEFQRAWEYTEYNALKDRS